MSKTPFTAAPSARTNLTHDCVTNGNEQCFTFTKLAKVFCPPQVYYLNPENKGDEYRGEAQQKDKLEKLYCWI